MDPSLLKIISDLGTLGVTVAVAIYLLRAFSATFKDLRSEEQKRTEAFMSMLGEQLKTVSSTAAATQATAIVLQGVMTEAKELVVELKALRSATKE